ncbi:MAG: hypothetical protein AAFO70_03565 [Pseudomonadota bacterium]
MRFDGLSDGALLILLLIALALPIAGILFARWRLLKRAKNYHWKPEQDYDVELRGESAFQPPITVLKKRDRKKR